MRNWLTQLLSRKPQIHHAPSTPPATGPVTILCLDCTEEGAGLTEMTASGQCDRCAGRAYYVCDTDARPIAEHVTRTADELREARRIRNAAVVERALARVKAATDAAEHAKHGGLRRVQ